MRRTLAWCGVLTMVAAGSCVVPIDDVSSSGGSGGTAVGASGGTQDSGATGGTGGAPPDSSTGAQTGFEGGSQGGTSEVGPPDGGTAGIIGTGGVEAGGGTGGTYQCESCTCAEIGRFATWCGKVNVLKDINFGWVTDSSCNVGCFTNTIEYCKQLWSGSIQMVEVKPVGLKTFQENGCNNQWPDLGEHEYVCYACVAPP